MHQHLWEFLTFTQTEKIMAYKLYVETESVSTCTLQHMTLPPKGDITIDEYRKWLHALCKVAAEK